MKIFDAKLHGKSVIAKFVNLLYFRVDEREMRLPMELIIHKLAMKCKVPGIAELVSSYTAGLFVVMVFRKYAPLPKSLDFVEVLRLAHGISTVCRYRIHPITILTHSSFCRRWHVCMRTPYYIWMLH